MPITTRATVLASTTINSKPLVILYLDVVVHSIQHLNVGLSTHVFFSFVLLTKLPSLLLTSFFPGFQGLLSLELHILDVLPLYILWCLASIGCLASVRFSTIMKCPATIGICSSANCIKILLASQEVFFCTS
jgi:hypothetical protein